MKKDELDYVCKAMRMDLTDVVNWDKPPELDYSDPVPSHYYHYDYEKVQDEQLWKDISSKICHIGEAI